MRIYILILLWHITPAVMAESFILGYSPEHLFGDKHILARITCAFNYAGHDVALVKLPAKRSLEMSKRANIDGDIGRVEQVYKEENTLLPIMAPISTVDLWVYGRLGLELNHMSDISNYTLVPILGIRYFERFPANMYKLGNQASSLSGALSMIRAKRGDYTFWAKGVDNEIERRNLGNYIVRYFDEPIDRQELFTLLNRKHEQHIPGLEKAYLATRNSQQCLAE